MNSSTQKPSAPWTREVEIQQAAVGDPKRKTRAFGATLVGLLRADGLWENPPGDVERPVMAVFAASELEAAAFEANLREGRGCVSLKSNGKVDARYEFPASGSYAWRRQRTEEGLLLTAYVPELFEHAPGFVDEWGARFVAMPSTAWAEEQRSLIGDVAIEEAVAHCGELGLLKMRSEHPDFVQEMGPKLRAAVLAMAPTAALAVSMLDRRVRAPIVADFRFQLQVFLSLHRLKAGDQPLAVSDLTRFLHERHGESCGFMQLGLASQGERPGLGYEQAVVVAARHTHVEQVLAFEVKRYREALGAREVERVEKAAAARGVKRPYAKRKVA